MIPVLDRVRLVVAIVRDVLLIAFMVAAVIVGARAVKAAHDAAPKVVTPDPAASCVVPDPANAELCLISGH